MLDKTIFIDENKEKKIARFSLTRYFFLNEAHTYEGYSGSS